MLNVNLFLIIKILIIIQMQFSIKWTWNTKMRSKIKLFLLILLYKCSWLGSIKSNFQCNLKSILFLRFHLLISILQFPRVYRWLFGRSQPTTFLVTFSLLIASTPVWNLAIDQSSLVASSSERGNQSTGTPRTSNNKSLRSR